MAASVRYDWVLVEMKGTRTQAEIFGVGDENGKPIKTKQCPVDQDRPNPKEGLRRNSEWLLPKIIHHDRVFSVLHPESTRRRPKPFLTEHQTRVVQST